MNKDEFQVGDLVTGNNAYTNFSLFGSRKSGGIGLIVDKYPNPNHYRNCLKVLWFNFDKRPLEQCDSDELRKLEIPNE
jgi:hypothetical protein